MNIEDMVFVGFNARAAALDRQTGDIIWKWQASHGSGFVSLLLDGQHLFAAVRGYTYGLEAATGQQLWMNPMTGFGYGVTSLATTKGNTRHAPLGQAAAQQAAAAAGAGGAAGS